MRNSSQKIFRGLGAAWLAGAMAFAVGCSDPSEPDLDDDSNSGGGAGSVDNSTDSPAFSEVYDSMLSSCTVCHSNWAKDADGGYTGAFNELVNVQAAADNSGGGATVACAGQTLVIPNDCAGSLLYQKLTFTHDCGGGMPQGETAPVISAEQDQLLCDWINGGANL